MNVFEVDFNNDKSENIPINIFSSLCLNLEGELIKFINIEPVEIIKEMKIEIFGNKAFYKNIYIDETQNSNIFSFKILSGEKFFIKVEILEFKEIIKTLSPNYKTGNSIFFGSYIFDTNLLNFINKKKLTNNPK